MMLKDTYSGKYAIIRDIRTNKIVASGQIVGYKSNTKFNNTELVSFDNHLFFRVKSDSYKLLILNEIIPTLIAIPENYNIQFWRDFRKVPNADVYKEFGIEELDPEVELLVTELNKIKGIRTTGSCSGHGKRKLYVDIIFSNMNSLKFLLDYICSNPNSFILKSDSSLTQNGDLNEVLMKLETLKSGDVAYKAAKNLSNFIKLMRDCES